MGNCKKDRYRQGKKADPVVRMESETKEGYQESRIAWMPDIPVGACNHQSVSRRYRNVDRKISAQVDDRSPPDGHAEAQ